MARRPGDPESVAIIDDMISIGTSGYSYPEWKGTFYPENLPASKMLGYYAERFPTVEINNTFYRLPSEKVIGDWARGTPDGFTFTLKATRRITHQAKLHDCAELLDVFCSRARALGPKLAVLLFQMPPYFRKDLEVLDEFLGQMPGDLRAAFEFRHSSWLTDEVYSRLRERNLALCITDSEKTTTPIEATADYGYFRLRDEGYQDADFDKWANAINERAGDWRDTFVYFKHEEEGKGPDFANELRVRLDAR